MRYFRFLLVVFLISGASALADKFVAGMGDLPLAPGLITTEDDVTIIDDEEQRFVETEAHGAKDQKKIKRYYKQTLSNLGWESRGDHFERENEILTIQTNEDTVTFRITPKD